ncbi:MAG: hypothetical protein JXR56_00045 [Candidatus Cloacimonetes bacterium]|nr:hypothetical protein [Candidatus Cloacimonadota bacterium]
MKRLLNRLLVVVTLFLIGSNSLYSTEDTNLMHQAEGYLYGHQYILAEKAFRNVLEADPTNARAREGIVLSYMGRNMIKEALSEAKQAASICTPNSGFYRLLGQIYFLEKDYYKSIDYYQRALLAGDNKEFDYTGLGISYSYLNYLKTSRNYLNQAVKLNSTSFNALMALKALDNLPWYFFLSSDYYQDEEDSYSISNSVFLTKNIYTGRINYKHFKNDKIYRDAYSLGIGVKDSGINSGIEFSYLNGNYDLLYDSYGGLIRIEKEFLHSSGKATVGYALAYFWYDVLSSIQNSIWIQNSINQFDTQIEISDIAQDYEVKDKDENNYLLRTTLIYHIRKNIDLIAYSSWGAHEFYYSPAGYIIDNYKEPNFSYGGALTYKIGNFGIKGSINNDNNQNLSYIFGFFIYGSVRS